MGSGLRLELRVEVRVEGVITCSIPSERDYADGRHCKVQ